MHHERDSAVSERNVVKAMYEQLTVKVIRQKNEAAALLKKLTAERDALQIKVNDAHNAQEKKDANAATVIDDLSRKLLAAGRLRDPRAGRGSGGAGAQGNAAAVAGRWWCRTRRSPRATFRANFCGSSAPRPRRRHQQPRLRQPPSPTR
jgi:hypothetical protein